MRGAYPAERDHGRALDPFTGAELSVSPLTWSHVAFVGSVERYLVAPTAAAAREHATRPV